MMGGGGGGGKSKNKYRAGETEKDRAYQRYSVRDHSLFMTGGGLAKFN